MVFLVILSINGHVITNDVSKKKSHCEVLSQKILSFKIRFNKERVNLYVMHYFHYGWNEI